ncbi:hypothetical protein WJX81_003568 [Elliptochloris bilobata]|uniref:Pentacotripeptide-repeat region of PRORP domain-containing protein n=1 Tax=Elliptochloris bilobata TaxID=381761 RepID=A0AAW1RFF2_9CHLO
MSFRRVNDMKSLAAALHAAREGTGEVRHILLSATFRPRLPGLTKMVSKLSKEGSFRKGLEVFDDMQARGVEADVVTCCSLISALERGGQWQLAEDLFLQMCQASEHDTPLLRTLRLQDAGAPAVAGQGHGGGSPAHAQGSAPFLGAPAAPWTPEGGPSEAVAAAAEEEGAAALLRELSLASGTSGSDEAADSGAGLPQQPVRQVPRLKYMNVSRIAPNRVCCNALLAAYARAKPPQWEKALTLLTAMTEAGGEIAPDCVTFNTALKACGNAGRLDQALRVYAALISRGVRPSVTTFALLLAAAAAADSPQTVRLVWSWLEESGLEINTACMNAYVSILVKQGQWDEARAAFRAMLSPAARCKPSICTINTILAAQLRQGQFAQVHTVFEDLAAAGLQPSVVTYNALLAAHAQSGAWQAALDCLQRMLRTPGVVPNAETFGSVLAAMARGAVNAPPAEAAAAAEASLGVFRAMLAAPIGGGAGAGAYGALMRLQAAAGQWGRALAVHELMLAQGLTPDTAAASAVIQAYAATGQPAAALAAWAALRSGGRAPEPPAERALLAAAAAAGAWREALVVLRAMRGGAEPPGAACYEAVMAAAAGAGAAPGAIEAASLAAAAGVRLGLAVAASALAQLLRASGWAAVYELAEARAPRLHMTHFIIRLTLRTGGR